MTEAQPKRQPGTGVPEDSSAGAAASGDGAAGTTEGERSSRLPRAPADNDEERDTLVPDARKRNTPAPTGTQIQVRVSGRTDVGLVREHNEDNFLLADLASGSREPGTFKEVSSAGLLLGVCDGMGGAAAGEVASQMAVDTILEMMTRSVPAADRDALARSLVRSVEEAGERIFEAARTDRSRRGMGTTATIAALMDKTLFVGQVGDSRAYILRAGELKQITKDQSLVNQLIEAGQLTEDEAEQFEHSNIILQALGTTEQVSVDLTFLELRTGDRLMMCSDGLSGLVHGEVIREVMHEYDDLDACGARLIELAKGAGGHDNVTVILCEFSGPGLSAPQPGDLAGYQQYPLPPDSDSSHSSLHSDVPTVAPPSSGRAPAGERAHGGDLEGADEPSGRSGRALFLLILAALLLGGFYWYAAVGSESDAEPEKPLSDKQELPPVAEVAGVEVVVRTDVEAGELLVDGESKGAAHQGRWVLSLLPGPHKLEARAAGTTVTSSTVTVREGVPATVLLSLPEGAELGSDAAVEGDAAPKKSEAEERAEARREKRRREREAASQAEADPAKPTPAAAREAGSVTTP